MSLKSQDNLPAIEEEAAFGPYRLSFRTGSYCLFQETPSNFPHSHNYHEFCLVLSGKGEYRHGSEEWTLGQGDLFLCDPGVEHEISSWKTRDLHLVFFILRIQKINSGVGRSHEEALVKAFLDRHRVLVRDQVDLAAHLPLLAPRRADGRDRTFVSREAFRNLILECVERFAEKPPVFPGERKESLPGRSEVDLALGYIARQFRRNLSVREVAEQVPTTERNLLRLFRKHLKKGVKEAIAEQKMNFAAHQLLMRFRLEEVASGIGIDSPSQFSQQFKKHFGLSPKVYQLRHAPSGPHFRTDRKRGNQK